MAAYNFKKHIKLYIVYGGLQYDIDISDISFSQTFTENSYEVKTLHDQSLMFEGSVINKANPANFEFSLPIIREPDFDILYDLAVDYDGTSSRKLLKTFDIYITTQLDTFKLTTCVITSASFKIEKSQPLGLSISGEAIKLTNSETLPLTSETRTTNPTYEIVRDLYVDLDSVSIPDSIYKATVELQNEINWLPYTTINNSLNTTDASTSMYPAFFTLEKRILAGSIGLYITDTNDTDLQQWSTAVPLRIRAGEDVSGAVRGFDFSMPLVSFTNRLAVSDVFTQAYDFRMLSNPTDLSTVISHTETLAYTEYFVSDGVGGFEQAYDLNTEQLFVRAL